MQVSTGSGLGSAPQDGTYAVFCPDRMLLRRLTDLLPSKKVFTTDRWASLERQARHARCVIIALRWLHQWFQQVSPGRVDPPGFARPLVVVTLKDADNAKLLKDIPADEVVWFQDVDRDLPRAVQRAESRGVLERLALAIERSSVIPLVLARALAHACRADPPIGTVARLGKAVGRDRRTLWRLWHRSLGQRVSWRLEDLLDWLILLRALSLKGDRLSWAQVATEVQVHEHTLGRLSLRLLRVPLNRLAELGEHEVARRLTHDLAYPLLHRRETIWAEVGRSAVAEAVPFSIA